MNPTPFDVLAFLGQPAEAGGDAFATIEAHLNTVTAMVRGYTRGRGFDEDDTPNQAIAAVIVSAAARSFSNPTHARQQSSGPYSHSPGVFHGWTLAELAILNNYRQHSF